MWDLHKRRVNLRKAQEYPKPGRGTSPGPDYHQEVSSNPRRQDASEGEVHRITTAPESLAQDLARRQNRYVIQMSVRVVCFLLAVFTWGHIPSWASLILLVATVVLPYSAVLFANAGRERNTDGADYLTQREITGGTGEPGGLGPAPTSGRGPESDA